MAPKPGLNRTQKEARIKRGLSVAETAMQHGATAPIIYVREIGRTRRRDADASLVGRVRMLPFQPTNLKLVDIKKAVRATLKERAAKPAE